MKIYLFLNDKIVDFYLPFNVAGSFSFDADFNEEIKLINVEARDGKWIIYSTVDVSIINNTNIISNIELRGNSFYVLRRNGKDYLIYVVDLSLNQMMLYSYDNTVNLFIGNNGTFNVQYLCPFLNNLNVRIRYVENKLLLENNSTGVYINNIAVANSSTELNIGDQINIYGLKLIILKNLILINNLGEKFKLLPTTNLKRFIVPNDDGMGKINIKDVELYDKNSYFSKSPIIRRTISTKVLQLSPPPRNNSGEELPLILTVGPMLTMGVSSGVMIIDVINKINIKETTFKDSWSSLVSSFAMLISMIMWPMIINAYNKNLKRKNKEKLVFKYGNYLTSKKKELDDARSLQKNILIENLITVDECLTIIEQKNMSFWNKRLDQNDVLVARIGKGNELFNVDIKYPEEGFTIDEDELKKRADKLVLDYKYINDVPIGYSFYNNKLSAVMGTNSYKCVNFVKNIILQFITFYSYEDLKLVVFTNELNRKNWTYIKYLNHNFSNDKKIRFFSSTADSINKVLDYLSQEYAIRDNIEKNNSDKKIFHRPHYLIIVDDYQKIKGHEFVENFTEDDYNLGFSMIILEDKLSRLPSRCSNYIVIQSGKSGILKSSFDVQKQLEFSDEVKFDVDYMKVARLISNIPIEFEEKSNSLPDSISFMEMEKVGKVEQLNILNRWNINDSTISLKTEIGVNDKGELMYLDLHEKYHGPHGLIAGTTGSGKSEFIITYILSMCINYSPDDVSFILIDYKGGGLALAFENKLTGVVLPHLAGTITNLDKAEMDRTLVSIDSEVKRRQRMFNEARDELGESTIDIYKYQRHYHDGRLKEAIPHLFIICDEFAELKSQQPDFMDNLISIARIGRSLGIHLILATQKPSGVVNDQIWSNTKFRVCLKVQDEADSKEMLKRPEAAHIIQTGRFYLQVGYDEVFALGQSGWCGAKYYPADRIVRYVDKSIDIINECGNIVKNVKNEDGIKLESHGEQLAAIMNNIIECSKKVNKKARRLWLDNIPSVVLVDYLYKKYNFVSKPFDVEVIVGEYDAPENQEQGLVKYSYINDGNTIIYSQNSSESEMFISTLLYATTKYHTSDEINFYIIDYGSESLGRYFKLPHIGGIVFSGDDEKYNNLIKMITNEINDRKKKFIDYGGDYSNYIKNNDDKLPIKVVIVNNFDSFYETYQDVYESFPELVRDSVRYGIIFIFTCNAINSVPNKISQNFSNMYAFKIKDPSDYMFIFNSKSHVVPRDIEGRGILNNGALHEFQIASITDNNEILNDYIIKFIDYQKKINKAIAQPIPSLPNHVRFKNVKDNITDLKNVPIGIAKHSLEICNFNFISNIGTIITSNKIENMDVFVNSLLAVLRIIPGVNLIIIDPMKTLKLDFNYYPNYYSEQLDEVIFKIGDYLDKLFVSKSKTDGILVIYGLSNFPDIFENIKIQGNEDISIWDDFFSKIYKYKNIGIIGIDDSKKIKELQYEDWYTKIFSSGEGIWVGKGIDDQNILKTDSYGKEFQVNYKNDMGFQVVEGDAVLIKLIDFVTKEDDVVGK